ncbi:unnamed protein product [Orchesella dallaii]|uniref:MAGE domain-containing protein n=1 Tax=Orchesella dallaii TaxID=48710 RepID=A0ABP1RMV0_9HEXA
MSDHVFSQLHMPPVFSDESDSEPDQSSNQMDQSSNQMDQSNNQMDQSTIQMDQCANQLDQCSIQNGSVDDVPSNEMEQPRNNKDDEGLFKKPCVPKRHQLRSRRQRGSQQNQSPNQAEEAPSFFGTFSPPKPLTVHEMVKNSMNYFLIMQDKKVPVKRADLVRIALGSQSKRLPEVLTKLQKVLEETFGMRLITLNKTQKGFTIVSNPTTEGEEERQEEEDKMDVDVEPQVAEEPQVDEEPQAGPSTSSHSINNDKKGKGKKDSMKKLVRVNKPQKPVRMYMLVSKLRGNAAASVMNRELESGTKLSVIFLVLSTIFMEGKPMHEDKFWRIVEEMEFHKILGLKRETFSTYVRLQYVNTAYLAAEVDEDGCNLYSWGVRAELEYSKLQMLKFVQEQTAGTELLDFQNQCKAIMKGDNVEDKEELRQLLEERNTQCNNTRYHVSVEEFFDDSSVSSDCDSIDYRLLDIESPGELSDTNYSTVSSVVGIPTNAAAKTTTNLPSESESD